MPPYVSYRTFWNFLESLKEGIPSRIDRSYWGDRYSGSTGTQLVSAVRYLGLVDNEGMPTASLKQLVSAKGAQKSEILKQIANESFGFLFEGSFDAQTATYAQLEEAFHAKHQLTSDVARKCIKFFIGLANDATIPLSPFMTKRSRATHTTTGAKKSIKKVAGRTKEHPLIPQATEEFPDRMTLDRILMNKLPNLDPNWPDEVKLKWFEAFDQLLKRVFASSNGK